MPRKKAIGYTKSDAMRVVWMYVRPNVPRKLTEYVNTLIENNFKMPGQEKAPGLSSNYVSNEKKENYDLNDDFII